MIIEPFYIPEKIRWIKNISQDPLENYSAKQRGRIRSTIENMPASVEFSFSPLTQELVDWFTPLYSERMSEKDNPKIFDVGATTLHAQNNGEYWIQILTEKGERTGATIFSIREKQLNLVYRTYANTWKNEPLRATPSLIADYLISEKAFSLNKLIISHGKDRNVYGKHAAIGLAAFKLSIGCYPILPEESTSIVFNPNEITDDCLVITQDENRQINKGILFCTNETEGKYEQIKKYPTQLPLEVIFRD